MGNIFTFEIFSSLKYFHSGLLAVNTLVLALLMGLVLYQGTEAWAGPLISFLCMLVKMNISATFVVAYIQVSPSTDSIRAWNPLSHKDIGMSLMSLMSIDFHFQFFSGDGGFPHLCQTVWYWFLQFHLTDDQYRRYQIFLSLKYFH